MSKSDYFSIFAAACLVGAGGVSLLYQHYDHGLVMLLVGILILQDVRLREMARVDKAAVSVLMEVYLLLRTNNLQTGKRPTEHQASPQPGVLH